jgi:hypothetical protein
MSFPAVRCAANGGPVSPRPPGALAPPDCRLRRRLLDLPPGPSSSSLAYHGPPASRRPEFAPLQVDDTRLHALPRCSVAVWHCGASPTAVATSASAYGP